MASNKEAALASKKLGKDLSVSLRVLLAVPFYLYNNENKRRISLLCNLLTANEKQAEILSFDSISLTPKGKISSQSFVFKLLRQFSYLRKIIYNITRFDVLHLIYISASSFYGSIVPLILIGKFFGKKVILDYHNLDDFFGLHENRIIFKKFINLCDSVILISDYQRQAVDGQIKKSCYLPDAFELDNIQPRVIRSVQPKIVVWGISEKIDNFFCVLRAFHLVKQKYPRAEMLMIGVDHQLNKMKDITTRKRIGGITFIDKDTKQQNDKYLSEADVYVNCLKINYLPDTMLNALAMGIPVITTPANTAETFVNRQDVLYVRYNDCVGIADSIIELVENPSLVWQLSQAARKKVKPYSWSAVKKEWLDFYRQLQ
ncbi:MAG: glycosyltransferase family 4 protein [FCB group bacterium]|nr:glycosyltransferase family 4 protein [FCB group bacterium]